MMTMLDSLISLPRFSRRSRGRPRMVAPIVSDKKFFETGISVPANTRNDFDVFQGVDIPALLNDIKVGTKVYKFIYFIVTAASTSGAVGGTIQWYFCKRRSAQSTAEFPEPEALSGSNVRNQIFKSGLSVFGSEDGMPARVHSGQLKIPKTMHRTREGDVLAFVCKPTVAIGLEIKAVYKVYS